MKTVRVGIIGAGWVVRNRHLPALKNIPEVQVTQIWSRDPEKARQVATEFAIPRTAAQWQDVADSPDIDAVIVAAPPILHLAATAAALKSGKHVLCQGRMARNLKEAQEMARAAGGPDRVTALYPARPGLKGDRVMRRLLRDQQFVGEIREVRVTALAWTEPKETYEWTRDPKIVGVHAMMLGILNEIVNRWLGPATRVLATGKTHRPRMQSPQGGWFETPVPDSLTVAADLACGATASYHLSSCAALAPGHSIEIYGSRGTLIYQLFKEEIRGAAAGAESLQPIPIPPDDERAQTTDIEFIQAIREGTPVSPDFEEGLRYMEFCEAAALSLKAGAAVAVPPRPMMDSWAQYLEPEQAC